jgi:RNA polymerase sigma-70 factor (ECF subfamily)
MDLDVYLPAILDRDAQAFGRWMAGAEGRMRDSLRSFATVVDVEAVLQESLLRVWQVAPRFEPDGKPDGLLRMGIRIARNLAVSEVRRTRARPIEGDDLEAAVARFAVIEHDEPDPMLRDAIARCREKLPDKPRQALDARLSPDGPRDDIDLAATLGMRLNTFLQNFTRARRLLAECLAKFGVRVDAELST